ncbi:hypothetical protein ACF9IK_36930 [Kitasatospora hibisci]|uniref:hypothetical protein n=1 Tax=Kitasatospora hibisci TaxID=3369522 RepID=UPI00375450F4
MIDKPGDTWSFVAAREPAVFPAAEVHGVPGVQHAADAGRTLCGIRGRYLTFYLHHFEPQYLASCHTCRGLAEAAPTRPCAQERLHDRLQADAPDSPLREDLLTALRRGARIAIWITAPAAGLTRHYARLDQLTEGAGPAAAALAAGGPSITLARVEDAGRGGAAHRYLVVLPFDGPPRIARGPLPPQDPSGPTVLPAAPAR